MPGLTGILGGCFASNIVERMIRSMQHESFYKVDRYVDRRRRFGVARIGPDDFIRTKQPGFNQDGTILAMMTGEIYNRKELARGLTSHRRRPGGGSDLELLIQLYEDHGETFLTKVKGQFVVFLYDMVKRTAIIGNDRFGFMPVYYASLKDSLLFSCEVKSLLQYQGLDRSLNMHSISDFIHYETLLDHKTFFKAVSHLPPGHLLIFRRNKTELQSYWSPKTLLALKPLDLPTFIAAGNEILQRSVRECLTEGKVGLSLTGGWDTRAILAVLDPTKKIPCFTLTGGYRDCIDAKNGRRLAELCRQPHHKLELGGGFIGNFPEHAEKCVFISDGMASIGRAHEIILNAMAREYCDIRMTGEGASQISKGTSLFRDRLPHTQVFSVEFQQVLNRHQDSFGDTFLKLIRNNGISKKEILLFILEQELRQGAKAGNRMLELSQIWIRTPYTHEDFVEHMFRAPGTYQVDESLERMAHRSPTDRMVSKLRRLIIPSKPPPLHRYIIERNRPALMRVPVNLCEEPVSWNGWAGRIRRLYTLPMGMLDSFYHYYDFPGKFARLDHAVQSFRLDRLFSGFQQYVHYRQWLAGPLRNYVREVLLDSRTLSRGYFDRRRLEKAVESHVAGRACYSAEFARLITLELWHRLFVDRY